MSSNWRALQPSSSSSPPMTPRSIPPIDVEIRGIKHLFADDEGLSFVDLDARATFFRVSAERGRWRYDPPRIHAFHRQSTPVSSLPPIPGLAVPPRPISEPPAKPRAYSPLPPSSPPLLSRSISPLSFAPSSPSSPLSFLDLLPPSDLADDADEAAPNELFGDEEADASGSGLQPKELKEEEALRTMDENGVDTRVSKTRLSKTKGKRERERDASSSSRKKAKVLCVEKSKTTKRSAEEENEPAPKQKKQKKLESSAQRKRCVDAMTASKQTASPSPLPSKTPYTQEDPAVYAEIRGILIESMATSRASSLPASALYKHAVRCRPALEAQRSEREWMQIIERVLGMGEAGTGTGGSGVFGKVESSFKDDAGRPLEAQWFYVPEKDEDQERAALIRSMMPRPAKRNETKKYKQYYYRPLAKITRWDREEDL